MKIATQLKLGVASFAVALAPYAYGQVMPANTAEAKKAAAQLSEPAERQRPRWRRLRRALCRTNQRTGRRFRGTRRIQALIPATNRGNLCMKTRRRPVAIATCR